MSSGDHAKSMQQIGIAKYDCNVYLNRPATCPLQKGYSVQIRFLLIGKYLAHHTNASTLIYPSEPSQLAL